MNTNTSKYHNQSHYNPNNISNTNDNSNPNPNDNPNPNQNNNFIPNPHPNLNPKLYPNSSTMWESRRVFISSAKAFVALAVIYKAGPQALLEAVLQKMLSSINQLSQ